MLENTSRDETGQLAEALRGAMHNPKDFMEEISNTPVKMAGGDPTIPGGEITSFLGDFAKIKKSFGDHPGRVHIARIHFVARIQIVHRFYGFCR